MKNKLKKLAGETAIYGIPSIVGRVINFALTPLYIYRLKDSAAFGEMSVLYAIAGFVLVVLTHGMETGFFNFIRKNDYQAKTVFNTGLSSVGLISLIFALCCLLFATPLINLIGYPGKEAYIYLFAGILSADALSAIPFAWLRYKNKAVKFATFKSLNILINVLLALFFFALCPYLVSKKVNYSWLSFYEESKLIHYAFFANLIASASTLILLLTQVKIDLKSIDKVLHRKMLSYSYPLIFTGMAGIVNETFDRILLKKLLPSDIADQQVGIYTAFYKLSMFMTLFVQAFRFAAEPFFFKEAEGENPKQTYAKIMEYFVYACLAIFVLIMLALPYLAPLFITKKSYFVGNGLQIVPILLLANMFLGIYYNLSIWYKLTNNTKKGAFISIIGALLTLIINAAFIPIYGFMASAWATLAVYVTMTVMSYLMGKKHYQVPYNLKNIALAIILVIGGYVAICVAL